MKKDNIIYAVNRIGITYMSPQQSTIIKMDTGELIYGFFKNLDSIERNIWLFTKFNGSEDITIDGDKIYSISLEENGKVIFYRTDNEEIDNLHLSVHK